MKKIKKTLTTLLATTFIAIMALNLNSCSEQSPLSSDLPADSNSSQVHILKIPEGEASRLNKVVAVSGLITVKKGGQLHLTNKPAESTCIEATLDVAPGSISADAIISLSLDDELLAVNVSVPQGVTFGQIPELTIKASGIDLEGFGLADLGVYTENSSKWLPVPDGSLETGVSGGSSIVAVGVPVTTNSRYAIGME